jgi:hypothetical protein
MAEQFWGPNCGSLKANGLIRPADCEQVLPLEF